MWASYLRSDTLRTQCLVRQWIHVHVGLGDFGCISHFFFFVKMDSRILGSISSCSPLSQRRTVEKCAQLMLLLLMLPVFDEPLASD